MSSGYAALCALRARKKKIPFFFLLKIINVFLYSYATFFPLSLLFRFKLYDGKLFGFHETQENGLPFRVLVRKVSVEENLRTRLLFVVINRRKIKTKIRCLCGVFTLYEY